MTSSSPAKGHRLCVAFVAVGLLAATGAGHAAPVPVWDQTGLTLTGSQDTSLFVPADDFQLTGTALITGATLMLADSVFNDNGLLDNCSGKIGWGIYAEDSLFPGALIAAGQSAGLIVADTGLQADAGVDLAAVSFELSEPVQLGPGTYFLAIHDGAWGELSDLTPCRWQYASEVVGEGLRLSSNEESPGNWFPASGPVDAAFALYAGTPVWNQSSSTGSDGFNITDSVGAADFVLSQTASFSTLDVWLLDAVPNDIGALDNFSGTLSWAIYVEVSGKPGTLLMSGTDTSPRMADTGRQASNNSDLIRARISLGGERTLAPGIYWVALHEGAWGSPTDHTGISWAVGTGLIGQPMVLDSDPTSPGAWDQPKVVDPAFLLFDDQLFASGFETGRACAWSLGICYDFP